MNKVYLVYGGICGDDGGLYFICGTMEKAVKQVLWMHPDFTLDHEYAEPARNLRVRFDGRIHHWARIDERTVL